MDRQQITLRKALPKYQEGLYFARYLDMAAEGFFHMLLGRNSADILARVYLQPDHDLSYQHVIFAELDGRIVGMYTGYSGEQHRHADPKVLGNEAGYWNLRFWIVSLLFAPMLRIIDTVDDGDFYLQAIAVDSNLQGKGIGSSLLDGVAERAIDSGASRLALDVSAANDQARQLYERRGFSIESTWPKRFHISGFKFHRMIKVLA
ncbi:MAG: GNAT family N-acetyltransferase [Gammaproteobacteria bacterium]|nr:GNAT family N-acetyltransferase [Gammaproteobacteria bacterium]